MCCCGRQCVNQMMRNAARGADPPPTCQAMRIGTM
ncbi:hypothetical protein XOCgx_4460 [Xanthomonas oryzae pv. oryzicola]|nr:hypothetical protein XOCgx_4460 [Xanthomonas oryzae pv. oryzicola]